MLHDLKKLENYKISATDGEIGQVKDFYFDDDKWTVRYLIVETGTWLSSRKVLTSPISLQEPDWQTHTLAVAITMAQVKSSPDIDTNKPVSRQNEEQYLNHYGYPAYWSGAGIWGAGLYPYASVPGYASYPVDRVAHEQELEAYLAQERARHRNDDPHLRSCNAVTGHHIHATDGEIGHVAGFVVDDQTWAIRYLIVDTSNWWLGHKVLLAPHWITEVNWAEQTVTVDLNREFIKNATAYDTDAELTRDQERGLYRHYGSRGYWAAGTAQDVLK
jgi:hypothetical protein